MAIQPFYSDILTFIFGLRYVTASHVQRYFSERLLTERTAQRHLANMVDHGLIAVASTRGTSPNFPFVYFVTRKGIRFLKENLPNSEHFEIPATEERRSRGQSLHSLLHELFVSEFSLMLLNTVRNRQDLQLLSHERRYFRRDRRLTYQANDGGTGWIEPDLGFLPAVVAESGRKIFPLHFVEMELGSHRVAKLRQKLAAYDRWAATESQEYLHTVYGRHTKQKANENFRLLIVACDPYGRVGDSHKLLELFIQATMLPPRMRDRIWLCRGEDLKPQFNNPAPLSAPVWYRAKDAKTWLPEVRRTVEKNGDRGGQRRARCIQNMLVAEKFSSLRQHVLFPY